MKLRERMDKLKRKQKGFTLVELIVVIAVIGILAGVMLPRFFGFTDDARKSAIIAETKSIRSIAETYYANNGDWPTITITDGTFTIQGNATPVFSGTMSSYSTTEAGTPVATTEKIPASFNYKKSGNNWIASCDTSGNVTARKQ